MQAYDRLADPLPETMSVEEGMSRTGSGCLNWAERLFDPVFPGSRTGLLENRNRQDPESIRDFFPFPGESMEIVFAWKV